MMLSQYQATTDVEEVDLNLIEALLHFVCGEGQHKAATGTSEKSSPVDGAILIFLPGTSPLLYKHHTNLPYALLPLK